MLSSTLAQLEAPKLQEPIVVTLKEDGKPGPVIYAKCVNVGGHANEVWQLQRNEPDNRTTETYNRNAIFDWEYETAEAMQVRFDKYFTEKGFVKVPTMTGWIHKDEYEFARRALAKTEELQARMNPPLDAEQPTSDAAPEGEATAPAFLTLWGPQIALVLGGLVLAGIIVKLMVLGGNN
ncbi:MAG: hypothetical protein IT365_23230 [Candidatus Hydrogenedentes bacterium]|nr:hypothetical protein [Candidatus Hydrogenedentota bacterium]